jgi:hypothetical protein
MDKNWGRKGGIFLCLFLIIKRLCNNNNNNNHVSLSPGLSKQTNDNLRYGPSLSDEDSPFRIDYIVNNYIPGQTTPETEVNESFLLSSSLSLSSPGGSLINHSCQHLLQRRIFSFFGTRTGTGRNTNSVRSNWYEHHRHQQQQQQQQQQMECNNTTSYKQ